MKPIREVKSKKCLEILIKYLCYDAMIVRNALKYSFKKIINIPLLVWLLIKSTSAKVALRPRG